MRRYAAVALIAGLAVLTAGGAACGSSSDEEVGSETTEPSAGSTSTSTDAGGTGASAVEITVSSSDLGDIVVDGEGRTLYLFTPDTGPESTCYDACEAAWPPLVGEVTAGAGITGEVGTTTRNDGSSQATLGGHPLYLYASDVEPGDTSGQGVGGVWFVVDGAGDPVEDDTSSGVVGY